MIMKNWLFLYGSANTASEADGNYHDVKGYYFEKNKEVKKSIYCNDYYCMMSSHLGLPWFVPALL